MIRTQKIRKWPKLSTLSFISAVCVIFIVYTKPKWLPMSTPGQEIRQSKYKDRHMPSKLAEPKQSISKLSRNLTNNTLLMKPPRIKAAIIPTKAKSLSVIEELNSYKFSRSQLPVNASERVFIEDIFIGLKSTQKYHSERLDLLLRTWIPQAKESVHLMTDGRDAKYSKIFGNRYIDTKCGSGHSRDDLQCKLQAMLNTYFEKKSMYKWFCTVDDDTYVNIPALVKLLRKHDFKKSWFLGKNSLDHKATLNQDIKGKKSKVTFWFATGGAVICLSSALTDQMEPITRGTGFVARAQEVRAPDDTALGYVCNYLLKTELTVIPEFHSHLEGMWHVNPRQLHKQVSLSWGKANTARVMVVPNVLVIRGEIPEYPSSVDPTRALTVHCYLFPNSPECKKIQELHGPPVLKSD